MPFISSRNQRKIFIYFLAFWLILIIVYKGQYSLRPVADSSLLTTQRNSAQINKVKFLRDQLRKCEEQIYHLPNEKKIEPNKRIIQKSSNHHNKTFIRSHSFPRKNEQLSVKNSFDFTRRRIGRGLDELQWHLTDMLTNKKLPKGRIVHTMMEHLNVLRYDMRTFYDYGETMRKEELASVSSIIQTRLLALQTPNNCLEAKKLICDLNKRCGFGCQIHHVTYCFIAAYALKRTFILKSNDWSYAAKGWSSVFLSLSPNGCDETTLANSKRRTYRWGSFSEEEWFSSDLDKYDVSFPIIDLINASPSFLPLSIPSEFASIITEFHGNPFAWFASHFMNYLLRPSTWLKNRIDSKLKELGYRRPIVGVHVRRTDKIKREAKFHEIDEYMREVEMFFNQLEFNEERVLEERLVYLATDDRKLFDEAKRKYPRYKFLHDVSIAKSAEVNNRYSVESLVGLLIDIEGLANADFIVCTFSSQVCRVAYEVMQMKHTDASDKFRSLDDIYYFGGQLEHFWRARFENRNNGIQFKKNDLIAIKGNHWNGEAKGLNKKSDVEGVFPAFKAEDEPQIVQMSKYDDNSDL
ncbi:hypothetical protein SNEBB_005563 [Seison nebaliae]|nr:hypothetical protein SNEBB_005563 [Seison nebaliae]